MMLYSHTGAPNASLVLSYMWKQKL